MPDFTFDFVWVLDSLGNFIPEQPPIPTTQIVKLFFYRRLRYAQDRRQILVRNISAIRSKINAQRLKQSKTPFALAFLAEALKRLFDYCRSPAQIVQSFGRPRSERLRRD